MGRITVDLLRRRAEHNEGCLSTLEEVALHQQELERIEVLGDLCRELQILYLCNNYIPRIEGLHHLKSLTYLNLAVNNITRIEGLTGCESLKKLDLTLNFIGDMIGVEQLRANGQLECLHLTGNPCTRTPGYRAFVVHTLPHLEELDGEYIVRSEKILARQNEEDVIEVVNEEALKVREQERLKQEMIAKGIDPFPPKYNEKGERLYGHSPEERMEMLRETQEEEERKKNPPKDPNSISALHERLEQEQKARKLTPAEEIAKYGRLLMRNEGKVPFHLNEDGDTEVVITVEPGKFISTTLINVEVEPTYARVTIKGKVLQLPLTQEVSPSQAKVQRSSTTGQLCITIPLAPHILKEREIQKKRFCATDDTDE